MIANVLMLINRLITTTFPFNLRLMMKRRSLAGNCGVGVFVIVIVTILIAFATPSWLVSDYRISGAKLDRLGLWTHCFRSLPDVNDDYQRRFFVGCRWVYDPFTTGYDEIRGFLIPRECLLNLFHIVIKLTEIETLNWDEPEVETTEENKLKCNIVYYLIQRWNHIRSPEFIL